MTDLTKHPHWPLMQKFFKAASKGRLLRLQVNDDMGCWQPLEVVKVDNRVYLPTFDPRVKYRIAPETIMVNGIEVEAPEKEQLPLDTLYWAASAVDRGFALASRWTNHPLDHMRLDRGLIYLSESPAVARAKAMLGVKE